MFSLERQQAKLSSVNARPEFHGEDTKTAMDLKVEIRVSNDVLSEFDPTLKASLYKKPEADLLDEPGYLPSLRYPFMGPVKWGKEFYGYRTVVHYGTGAGSDIDLEMCKVDRITFACQDGGTVIVGLRVQVHPQDEMQIGRLVGLAQREIELSLVPPEAETPDQLFN